MVIANQLHLSTSELNQIKLSTLIAMSEEIEYLNSKHDDVIIGNPADFKI